MMINECGVLVYYAQPVDKLLTLNQACMIII